MTTNQPNEAQPPKEPRPKYTKPVVLPLGGVATGQGKGGGNCENGSSNTFCIDGSSAGGGCGNGATV